MVSEPAPPVNGASEKLAQQQDFQQVLAVFRRCDGAGTGTISRENLRKVVLALKWDISEEELALFFQGIGADPIRFEDLLQWCFGQELGAPQPSVGVPMPPEGAVDLSIPLRVIFKEPKVSRYIHVDRYNMAFVMMPLANGDEVSRHAPGAVAVEVQRFLGVAPQSPASESVPGSSLHVLKRYLDTLNFDCWLLNALGRGQGPLYKGKNGRREQLTIYQDAIQVVSELPQLRDALQGPCPCFPEALEGLIQRSDNLQAMRLRSVFPSSLLRLREPAFALDECGASPFCAALLRRLRAQSPSTARSAQPPTLPDVFQNSLRADSEPSEENFRDMLQRLQQFVADRGDSWHGTRSSLSSLEDALCVSFPTLGDVLEALVLGDSVKIPECKSSTILSSASELRGSRWQDADAVLLAVQAFLALAWLFSGATEATPNLSTRLDSEAEVLAEELHARLLKDKPEQETFQWLRERLGLELPDDYLDRFERLWGSLAHSRDFGEFLVLFKDRNGAGVGFQGQLCVPFADVFLAAIPSEVAQTAEASASRGSVVTTLPAHVSAEQEQQHMSKGTLREAMATGSTAFDSRWRASLIKKGQSLLDNPNNIALRADPLELTQELLRSVLASCDACMASELLLATLAADAEQSRPEEAMFWRLRAGLGAPLSTLRPQGDWREVFFRMAALLPDQAELDLLSAADKTDRVWLRVTLSMAQSILTEASILHPECGLSRWASPSSQDSLRAALELVGAAVATEDFAVQGPNDGFTLYIPSRVQSAVVAVHARRRRDFHLTGVALGFLFAQIEGLHGSASEAYAQLQTLDNSLEPIPHPGIAATTLAASKCVIQAPAKAAEACRLLGIPISRWQRHRSDGWIVSASMDAIAALMRVMAWKPGATS